MQAVTSVVPVEHKTEQKENVHHSMKVYGSTVLQHSRRKRQDLEKTERRSISVHVVSHSHWDREWFRTQEEFNRILVTFMDHILGNLTDPESGVNHFLLDAQSVLIEDFLRSRPTASELVIGLINNNQLGVGPWYTQSDEFIPSGEALVRNLLYGIKTLSDLGGKIYPLVGYVPDQFGHTSQMPQIFLGFGLVAAATMRGIPLKGGRSSWWEGPDDSRILLLKLSNYCGIFFNDHSSNDAGYFEKILKRKLKSSRRKDEMRREQVSTLFYLNGCDHMDLDDQVGLAIANVQPIVANQSFRVEYFGKADVVVREVVHSDIETVARLVKEEVEEKKIELPVIQGELRNDIDHLLDGISSGMSLKRKNWVAQELLQSWVEPLHITRLLKVSGSHDESVDIERAWKLVLENHFHDTICTTSIGQVMKAARSRADRAIVIAESLASQFMVDLMQANCKPHEEAVFVFNPSNLARKDELVVVYVRSHLNNSDIFNLFDNMMFKDVETGREVEGTILGKCFRAFEWSHPRHEFRKSHSFLLLKIALIVPLVGAREMRLFQVIHTPMVAKFASGTKDGILENGLLHITVNRKDGSVSIKSMQNSFPEMRGINRLAFVSDVGSQYQFIAMQEYPLLTSISDVKMFRCAQHQSAQVRLSFGSVEVEILYLLGKTSRGLQVLVSFNHKTLRNFALVAIHPFSCEITETVHDVAFAHVTRSPRDRTSPHQKWVLGYGKSCAFGVATKGLLDSRVTFGGEKLHMILMRGVGAVRDFAQFSNVEAQDFGEHEFEYMLLPLKREAKITQTVKMMNSEANEFHSPLCPVQNINYGVLPASPLTCVADSLLKRVYHKDDAFPFVKDRLFDTSYSYFRANENVMMPLLGKNISQCLLVQLAPSILTLSAVKKWTFGWGIIVRAYNANNEQVCGILTFQVDLEKAFITNLNEEKEEEIQFNGNGREVHITLKKFKILTILGIPKRNQN